MKYTTYSFEDVTCSFQHKGVGAASSTGAGMGSISVAQANDKSHQEVAADGNVMISRLAGENGTVTLTMQQTSELHKYLLKWYNYVNIANISEFAEMSITIKSNNLGETTVCTGVTPQKRAERVYQAQGQHVTWNLLSAEITEN